MTIEDAFVIGFAYGEQYGYYNGEPPADKLSDGQIASSSLIAKEIFDDIVKDKNE